MLVSAVVVYRIQLQLKVVELTDALESSGSYTKVEISERVAKFRDKLMQVPLIVCLTLYVQ